MQHLVLGVRSQPWHGLPLEEQLARIANHGFKYVNLILEREYSKSEFNKISVLFKDLGLYSGQLGIRTFPQTFSRPEDWPSGMDIFKKLVEYQSILGGKQLCKLAGTYSVEYPYERSFLDSVAAMQQMCDEAAKAGMFISLEFEPEIHFVNHTFWGTLEYYTQVNRDNLLINIDTGHMNCMQLPYKCADLLLGKVAQMHLTDNDGTMHHGDIFKFGNETVDMAAWVRKAKEVGIEEIAAKWGEIPAAILEFTETEHADVVIDQMIEHCKKVIPEVRMDF